VRLCCVLLLLLLLLLAVMAMQRQAGWSVQIEMGMTQNSMCTRLELTR
jgi:hypothetical protein